MLNIMYFSLTRLGFELRELCLWRSIHYNTRPYLTLGDPSSYGSKRYRLKTEQELEVLTWNFWEDLVKKQLFSIPDDCSLQGASFIMEYFLQGLGPIDVLAV